MLLAKVVGNATATTKHESLTGFKLLVVQPYKSDGRSTDGDPLLVVDPLGAGQGDLVIVSSDGPAVRELMQSDRTPVRYSVIGTCD